DQALATIDEATRINPTLAIWHEAKGDVYINGKRDPNSAVASYLRAHDYAPRMSTLAKIVETSFMTASPNCNELVKRLSAQEGELKGIPILREGYARALSCAGKQQA